MSWLLASPGHQKPWFWQRRIIMRKHNFNLATPLNVLVSTHRCCLYFQYSVVRHWDSRPEGERSKHLFFIFFEWKNDLIEQSYLIYTTTPWSIGAGLCGVFLTLHRGYQLAQTSYKRMQKDKRRRTIRKQTIRELKRQKSEAHSSCHEAEVWSLWETSLYGARSICP